MQILNYLDSLETRCFIYYSIYFHETLIMKKLKIDGKKGYRHNKITFSITAHFYTFSIIGLSLLTIFDKWTK